MSQSNITANAPSKALSPAKLAIYALIPIAIVINYVTMSQKAPAPAPQAPAGVVWEYSAPVPNYTVVFDDDGFSGTAYLQQKGNNIAESVVYTRSEHQKAHNQPPANKQELKVSWLRQGDAVKGAEIYLRGKKVAKLVPAASKSKSF